ncbi:MAG: plasmid mobilization relaxosome protein MobC [Gammaproteobacteria bacterium]|nr:plasmid mobilization relaxosome protein MobC [Gammaproteobacteria bacterium]
MTSGSDKRQRPHTITVRLSGEERDALQARATERGLAVGAFARAAMLGNTGPRAKRRPTVDQELLRRVLGQIGKVGGNINQIAHRLNSNGSVAPPELRDALDAVLDIRAAIYSALGLQPEEGPPDDHQGQKPVRS